MHNNYKNRQKRVQIQENKFYKRHELLYKEKGSNDFKGRVNEIPVSSRKICAQRGRKKKKNGIEWSNIQLSLSLPQIERVRYI